MPSAEVWCLPAYWVHSRPTKGDYTSESATWPGVYQYLLETLAASIELTPSEFSYHVCRAERQVLRLSPEKLAERGSNGRKERAIRGDGKRANSTRKRRRVLEEDSSTDVSSEDMVFGSDSDEDLVFGSESGEDVDADVAAVGDTDEQHVDAEDADAGDADAVDAPDDDADAELLTKPCRKT